MLNRYGFTDDNGELLAVDGVFGPKSIQAIEKMKTYQQHLTNPNPETKVLQAHLSGMGFKNADDAAKYFYSNGAMSDTANNKVERSCIIIPVTLPVADEYGNLTNQTKYKIVGNFTGDYHFIGMEALAAAAALRARGIDCSVVHTHPAVQGQDDEHFSGLGSFGSQDWIGDYMLNWLGGVKNVYMANEKSKNIYVCDKSGPEMDPRYPSQYNPVGKY